MAEAMARWEVVERQWCDALEREAELMVKRVYPGDMLYDMQGPRIVARKCSCDLECNQLGIACKWAYTNPDNDPFQH